MAAAVVRRRTGGGMLGADLKRMAVHMVAVHVMKMTVVQVVDVVAVLNGDVTAASLVRVRVSLVDLAAFVRHRRLPPLVRRVAWSGL
jgi:hypothetical protein